MNPFFSRNAMAAPKLPTPGKTSTRARSMSAGTVTSSTSKPTARIALLRARGRGGDEVAGQTTHSEGRIV